MGSRRSYGSFYAVDFWCQVEGKVVWCGVDVDVAGMTRMRCVAG